MKSTLLKGPCEVYRFLYGLKCDITLKRFQILKTQIIKFDNKKLNSKI